MIAVLHPINAVAGVTPSNMFGTVLLAVASCFVVPFFLVLASVGVAGNAVDALARRRSRRRGKARWHSLKASLTPRETEPGRNRMINDKIATIKQICGV